jgi:hypothetical protein
MRPWFTLTVIAIIAGCLLSFWLVVDFVLQNRVMFETPFTITLRVPFLLWSHRWTEVQFMYILSFCILFGAGIVAVTTLIFDAKRTLKVRQMRKELLRLQKLVDDAKAKVSESSSSEEPVENQAAPIAEAAPDETPPGTPEEIVRSFEDVVEEGDFLKNAQKRVDDELELHNGRRPEGDVRAIISGQPSTVSEHAHDSFGPAFERDELHESEEENGLEANLKEDVRGIPEPEGDTVQSDAWDPPQPAEDAVQESLVEEKQEEFDAGPAEIDVDASEQSFEQKTLTTGPAPEEFVQDSDALPEEPVQEPDPQGNDVQDQDEETLISEAETIDETSHDEAAPGKKQKSDS